MQTCGTSLPTILVADDDLNCLSMLSSALQESGHQVATATNGIEALEQLRINPSIALVITDIIMPVKEGIGLIRSIKRLYGTTKIIAMTGSLNWETVLSTATDFGVDVTLRKPFKINRLLELIELELGR